MENSKVHVGWTKPKSDFEHAVDQLASCANTREDYNLSDLTRMVGVYLGDAGNPDSDILCLTGNSPNSRAIAEKVRDLWNGESALRDQLAAANTRIKELEAALRSSNKKPQKCCRKKSRLPTSLFISTPHSSCISEFYWWEYKEGIGHNAVVIEFRNGSTVSYYGVPRKLANAFVQFVENGLSAGMFYNLYIKGKFGMTSVSNL